ncbi:threonine synthase [Haladaptatus halobius]|uniref:threonine synthase n=1 Tax=Haladaptatus halobius TaxID=2884875 RepID=UPI001D09DD41|nr:threonine synthase [Haladaptatus halobius]
MPFRCQSCGTPEPDAAATCDTCGGFVRYIEDDLTALRRAVSGEPEAALPDFGADLRMGEGTTALVKFDQTSQTLAGSVYGKLESLNPTCSFKDRGSSLIVSAVTDPEMTWEGLVVASTGNTAPSVSAYAARAGVPCVVLVPDGTSLSKLEQVAAHGIDIFTVDGSFSDCFQLADTVSDDRVLNATAVYSANALVASANRTVAFELVAELGHAPDWVTVPVGAGPLLGGTHFGFVELHAAGIIDSIPRMLCVQARGCHPIARAMAEGETVRPWTDPITTTVGAIADPLDGYAADGEQTRQAVLESDGDAVALDDMVIYDATDRLAATEGVYAEPASAASVAGIHAADRIAADETVVALVTGHGLKEPAESELETAPVETDASMVRDAVLSGSVD